MKFTRATFSSLVPSPYGYLGGAGGLGLRPVGSNQSFTPFDAQAQNPNSFVSSYDSSPYITGGSPGDEMYHNYQNGAQISGEAQLNALRT